MRTARPAAIALVAVASLLSPGEAVAAPRITAEPPLYPSFRAAALDYAVRCSPGDPVRLSVAAPEGTTVRVGSRKARGGEFGAKVALAPGQQVALRVRSGSDERTHHVRCLPRDFPPWTARRSGTPVARWYIVTPVRLDRRRPGYTIVFDRNGAPVWWMRDPDGAPFTGTLLPDGGIAWFAYRATPFAIDRIPFEEHRLDGRLIRNYRTVGTLTDHHELQVLPNGHAVMISYVPRDHVDLRPVHPGLPSDATVVDGVIQEVDRAGKLVWSWSSEDHIRLQEARRWARVEPVRLRDGRVAYDFVHMNGVDVRGNQVVVSTRHTDAVYGIEKLTGAVVWKLGGTARLESLKFADDPFGAVEFGGPHDPRLSADGRFLTLFDNGTLRGRAPRAVRYSIDPLTRTATLVQSVSDRGVPDSLCCGSARLLPRGHWAISWGGKSLVTESDAAGRRILELAFGVKRQSYRSFPVLSPRLSTSDFRRGMDAQARR